MQFKAVCQAAVPIGGLVKILLSVDTKPNAPTEHLLCNLLKSRGDLVAGKTYCITIEEEPE
jgi:hypothetical protein